MAALYGIDDPHATVRFSFGRATGASDIERAAEATARVVARLRAT
jgi:cysteine sulfinate desulfinase/cysteine desulfurase-like protein